MKNLTKLGAGILLLTGLGCQNATNHSADLSTHNDRAKIIFETDMGNDIDDALALDMLYKYLDQDKIELLAISNNKNSDYSVPFLDLMNQWYGYPSIPLGNVSNGANSEGDSRNYAQATVEYADDKNAPFKRSTNNSDKAMESTELYRKILAQQPDHSVSIVSVGFSTNIAKLLDTQPDQYSDLTGKELIAKKVKLLSMMAGHFEDEPFAEYNVKVDIPAVKKIFEEWPTALVTSPFEVGRAIEYPATSIQNDFGWANPHPLVIAYESYLKMPYDRPTWDLTSVLYAVEGNELNYFNESDLGIISVNDAGITEFKKDGAGQHIYLSVNAEQSERIKKHFINMITEKPQAFKN